jgi:hypothetical protein
MKSMTPREHKTGKAWSCIDCIHNLEVGEEDNLAGVPQANVLTENTNNDPDRTSRKWSLTWHCENTSLGPVVRLDPLSQVIGIP